MSNIHLDFSIRYCSMNKEELINEISWINLRIKNLINIPNLRKTENLYQFTFMRYSAALCLLKLGHEFQQEVLQKYFQIFHDFPDDVSVLI